MCRPRPVTSLTMPVARSAPGTRALTSVDLPTPLCPSSTLVRPSQPVAQRRRGRRPAASRRTARRAGGRCRRSGSGSARSALVRHSSGSMPGVVRRRQRPVDQAGARLGVGERDHDHQLVGVGDDDPLDGVVVVGGAAQHGASARRPRRSGPASRRRRRRRRPGAPGRRRRRPCGPAAGTSSPSRAARPTSAGVAAAVDGHDQGVDGVVVGRAVLGAGPGATAGPVEATRGRGARSGRPCRHGSRRAARGQAPAKPGNVLDGGGDVLHQHPGTASPRITAAWAIRWSA